MQVNNDIPTFKTWDEIPDTMATKTTLAKEHGRKLAPEQQPVGRKMVFNHRGKHVGYYELYLIADAIDKRKPTEAQLAALAKAREMSEKVAVDCCKCGQPIMRHYRRFSEQWHVTRKQYIEDNLSEYTCHICDDHKAASEWASSLLEQGDFVILDTETTDLRGEIIEIAIIDNNGQPLLNQRIKPLGEIAPGAYAVHGISLDDLQNEPLFSEVYPSIVEAVKGKRVVIYNASFDLDRIYFDCERHELPQIELDSICAMLWYAQWYGEWSSYHGDYRWQQLNGGHSALSDCLATLEIIKTMANEVQHG